MYLQCFVKKRFIFKGPPQPPYGIFVAQVFASDVQVSWTAGFDGGFDQTFVIQLSKTSKNWENVAHFFAGINSNLQLFTSTVQGLDHSSLYFLRMFAYNEKGASNYSEVLNFTTRAREGNYYHTIVWYYKE